jgi:AraC-like DNA-binding protein
VALPSPGKTPRLGGGKTTPRRPRPLIVVVDGHPPRCRVLARALGGAYQIQAAHGAQEAREALAQQAPQLVILTLDRDEAAGLTLLATFRQRSIAPVLLIARQLSQAAAMRAMECRANAYLKRPFSLATLCARIRALLAEGPPPEYVAERARQLIDGLGDLRLSGSEVAARLGVAEEHLRAVFRQRFGRTPAQYIRTARIRRAQHLLTTTTLRIADVAARAGFRDATYLGVVFTREVGLTPHEFRRTHWNPDGRRDAAVPRSPAAATPPALPRPRR